MTDAEHEKSINKIRSETEAIRLQIMQLEFQHKKDIVEADKQFKKSNEQITRQIKHIAKLVGITYEELDNMDLKLQETGRYLGQPRKRSTLA